MASLLRVQGLEKKYHQGPGGPLPALRGIDLTLERGETLALVGESGCGKSTLGRCVLLLERPSAGTILLDGVPLDPSSRRSRAALRQQTQLIFQDPFSSLDPRMDAAHIVAEPLKIHGLGGVEQVPGLLEQVGLDPELMDRFPHQLSGGQRQRLALARALASRPSLIVADEPTSSLDLPARARVIELLARLQREHNLAYLLISHDLQLVSRVAHKVAVMYLGRIVETGATMDLLRRPQHPYTNALVAAAPSLERAMEARPAPLQGEVPDPRSPPLGCPFHPRCPTFVEKRGEACRRTEPPLVLGVGGRGTACHEVSADGGYGDRD